MSKSWWGFGISTSQRWDHNIWLTIIISGFILSLTFPPVLNPSESVHPPARVFTFRVCWVTPAEVWWNVSIHVWAFENNHLILISEGLQSLSKVNIYVTAFLPEQSSWLSCFLFVVKTSSSAFLALTAASASRASGGDGVCSKQSLDLGLVRALCCWQGASSAWFSGQFLSLDPIFWLRKYPE